MKPRKWAPRDKSKGNRSVVVACRLRPQTCAALVRAARKRGWTTSAEVEYRLAQSFAEEAMAGRQARVVAFPKKRKKV